MILCERDLDEVLDSQERMLVRRNQLPGSTPERRRMLKDEYLRTLGRVKAMLIRRPHTQLLVIEYSAAISDPLVTAAESTTFWAADLTLSKMAAAVDPALHRNRLS